MSPENSHSHQVHLAVCENNAVSPFSHTETGKGAQGNRFPWEFTSIRQGTLEGPQPHLHSRGEKQELGLGLEKSMLLSLSITAFITLTNILHQWRKHLLSCWKALAHQSRLPKHKHHFPELANLPFPLGFTHWQQLLQVWSREVAQALLCQQSSPRRDKESSLLTERIHLDLFSCTNHLTNGSALLWIWQQLSCPLRSGADSENSVPGAQ